MKTKKELNALKAEVEAVSKERQKLTEEELEKVSGGFTIFPMCAKCGFFHPADQPCPKPLI